MNYPKYNIQAVKENTGFSFVSAGPKGEIKLFVLFKLINEISPIYNLELGPLISENRIDDLAVIANNDRDKILATVAACVFIFFETYPAAVVYFTGSTPARTRLYQRAIGLNIMILQKTFTIFGVLNEVESEFYVPGTNYSGFFVAKKVYI